LACRVLIKITQHDKIRSGNNGCSASKTRSINTLQPITPSQTQQNTPPDQFPEHQFKKEAGHKPAVFFLGVNTSTFV
jgi:hypothetical protein